LKFATFQGIVNGTSPNWQPFQGRRISRMAKTTNFQTFDKLNATPKNIISQLKNDPTN